MTQAIIGIISVRGIDYPPTARLVQAARQRGARALAVDPYTVQPAFHHGRPVLLGEPAITQVRAVMPRQGAEIKDACLPLIDHCEKMGLAVINSKQAILQARNKFFTLQAMAAIGLPVLDTIFVPRENGLREALAHFGDTGAVVKPVSGRQGSDVRRLFKGDVPDDRLRLAFNQGRGVLVQRYLPPIDRTDLRIVVIGGQVTAAMALQPAAGDFRANAFQGGRGKPVTLTLAQTQSALRAAQVLGLEIAGVDMMIAPDGQHYIGEVNYAPGFRMLEATTGVDVAGAMIDHALSRLP